MIRQQLLFKFIFLTFLIPTFSFAAKNSGPVEVKIRRLTEKNKSKKPITFSVTTKVLTAASTLKISMRSLEGNFTIKKSNEVKIFSGPIKQNDIKKTNIVLTPQQPGKHTLIIDVLLKDKTSDQSKSFTEVFYTE